MTNPYSAPTLPLPPMEPQAPVPGDAPTAPASGSRSSQRTIALVASSALLAGILGGGVGAATVALIDNGSNSTATASSTTDTASNVSFPTGSVAAVAAKVLPSVVSITFTGADGSGGEGSGVILTSDGRILTNNHVVEGAADGGSLTVTFSDGSRTSAEIVGRDPVTDLAVIQAKDVSGLKPATLGSSADVKVGQAVVAIGSPLGLSGTVTTGIISAVDRPVATSSESGGSGSVLNALQTDAAINPGNSGGALVDMSGRVIGINSAIATLGGSQTGSQSGSIGLGFSIPIDQAKYIVDQLVSGSTAEHGRLGVSVEDATGSVLGAKIGEVSSGSPAAAAGLRTGDVITGFGDQKIESSEALVAAVRSGAPGQQVSVTYVRDGQTTTTTVTLGSDAQS